jgi:hypothetical protein
VSGGRKERIGALIDAMNAIHIGELSSIDAKLGAAKDQLAALGESDLEKLSVEARERLRGGDAANFRRLVAQLVSRLGHLKS